jgi:DNA-binding response OmpR family regulator
METSQLFERPKKTPFLESKKKILIVDDEPNIANLIKWYLEPYYDVKCVYTAFEAEETLKTFKADLMTLDIMMYGEDGITFCKRLRDKGITKKIPIVFVSAKTDIDTKLKAFFSDSIAFIEKPFTKKDVLEVVESSLNKSEISVK